MENLPAGELPRMEPHMLTINHQSLNTKNNGHDVRGNAIFPPQSKSIRRDSSGTGGSQVRTERNGGGNETAVQDTQGKRILPEMERGAMHTVHKQGGKGHQRAGDAGNRGHSGGESFFRPQNL